VVATLPLADRLFRPELKSKATPTIGQIRLAFAGAIRPKCASRKKISNCRRCVFFNSSPTRFVSRENTHGYGKSASGKVEWRWDNSDPFGNNMPNENPSGLGIFEYNQRLPGQYFDKETGLHYNVNRDYDPSIGRYIQSDPIGLLGGINTYTYVGGNPLSYTDPKGKNLLVVAGAVVVGGAVITGAVTYANNGGNLNGAVSSGVDAGIGIGIAGLVALATPETLVGALAGAVWDIGTDLYDSAKSVVEIISPANGETMTPLNPPISSSPSGTGAACP